MTALAPAGAPGEGSVPDTGETAPTPAFEPAGRIAPKAGLRTWYEFLEQLRHRCVMPPEQRAKLPPAVQATMHEIEGYNRRLGVADHTVITLTPADVEMIGDIADAIEWMYQDKLKKAEQNKRFGR